MIYLSVFLRAGVEDKHTLPLQRPPGRTSHPADRQWMLISSPASAEVQSSARISGTQPGSASSRVSTQTNRRLHPPLWC